MSLDKRKVKILKAIISSYIDNAEAVGSRTISKKYELGVSPATIRNEMSDLEEMGFLVQPHASAGRIPTDKAYRYYVDDLWKKVQDPSNTNLDQLRNIIEDKSNELDSVFKNSVRILSQFTKYTSFIVAPQLKQSVIKRIQLVPITDTKLLLLIILQSNIVKQVTFRMSSPIPFDQMDKISAALSEKLYGYKLEDVDSIKDSLIEQLYHVREHSNDSLMELLPYLMDQISKLEEINVYSDGITNILDLPEYNDVVKAREFISFVEDKSSIAKLLQFVGENDLAITIGHENQYEALRDCSLITATYKFNGKLIGKIGVIGPTRMDYSKVISTVKSMSEAMNEIINQNFDDENKE
ncbi:MULTISPECIES: heat-inducible transcriptional repressor HrcA [Sedimentibacter]|uniref:Heat-inducible transcription repressor HrcA n=1 Tax=Sedimentibacter saalensis TaxID=130788 RepID=A0A562J181_9FIRM|nr:MULTISPECIES: heat-inducible transcriptional repressor HrcA [Sedimentibacter]TWH77019.1 heat-inducible transcription repressor HrcA [Sedimentibacter saalensis]